MQTDYCVTEFHNYSAQKSERPCDVKLTIGEDVSFNWLNRTQLYRRCVRSWIFRVV